MSVTLYTRLGRGRGLSTRLGPLWLLFFFIPLWLAEALTLLILWSIKVSAVASIRTGQECIRNGRRASARRAAIPVLTATIAHASEPAPTAASGTQMTAKGDGMAMSKEFVVGEEYPLAVIQEAFGGDNMSYLPATGGRIVCGRFTTVMNPNAPERVLVGDRPRVKRKAELLAQQGGTLPVFMKQGPNRWRYHGVMQVVGYETDGRIIESEARAAGRAGEIAGVLVLRQA